MSEITQWSLHRLREALRKKEVSAVEAARAHIDAIDGAGALNAVTTPTPERAIEMAEQSDKRLAGGEGGALEGIPLGVKDMFCTEGVASTACSNILEGFTPPYESDVTERLWRAGACLLGKLNCDEFAMGSSTETGSSGAVCNPWRGNGDARLTAGGSSGGSAAAVAARLMPVALGTDTGGSVRQPAALTGTVGLKPSYGRCSRYGIISYASSLDQAGVLARSVTDSAILLGAIAGHDPRDSTSADIEVPDYEGGLKNGVSKMRVGIPKEYSVDGMPDEISSLWKQAADWLVEQGAEIVEVSLPHTRHALPAYYIIAPAEASSNLARYDGVRYGKRASANGVEELYGRTRAEGFGVEVKRRILMGSYVLSTGYYDAYYLKAQRVRALVARDFDSVFEKVDVLLTPTTPSAAFALGEKSDDVLALYLGDIFTVPVNLAGLPAISVPARLNGEGLPLGVQLIGRRFDEATLLRAAKAVEDSADFNAAPQPWWVS
ncbi:MAG: Asp-tRNA(Asn)/Glu-tRNA(Gln) amidotransferase subunit GatA [Hyphomicrobiales bacterium]|nr:Asp-tRNA(Asn)/Glu-tRNA(Gln) amidotransferase subunit GatA [Hyphomicrobiales bacterium]